MSGAALQGGSPASRLRPAGPAAQRVAQEEPPEALDSKVSLKLSPEYRSSTRSGPLSAGFQAASVLAGRGRAAGRARGPERPLSGRRRGPWSPARHQRIQLAPTTNLLEG